MKKKASIIIAKPAHKYELQDIWANALQNTSRLRGLRMQHTERDYTARACHRILDY